MADPKKSRKNQADEPEVKSKSKPKAKAKKSETTSELKIRLGLASSAKVLSLSQKAKAARIAKQQEATERNRTLKEHGKLTPFELAKLKRKDAREHDPIVTQRRRRRESDAIRAENARILAKADAENKAATEILEKIHAKSSV